MCHLDHSGIEYRWQVFRDSTTGNGTVSIATVVDILYPHRAWLISPTLHDADYEGPKTPYN